MNNVAYKKKTHKRKTRVWYGGRGVVQGTWQGQDYVHAITE